MKRFQKTLALLLAMLMLLATLSVPAFATSYKVATLKTGTWYKLTTSDKLKTVYKIKLTNDSIVTVNWKGNNDDNANLYFCTNKACTNSAFHFYFDSTKGSRSHALTKGTYYIEMYEYDWGDKPSTQVKITYKKRSIKPTTAARRPSPLKQIKPLISPRPLITATTVGTKSLFRRKKTLP